MNFITTLIQRPGQRRAIGIAAQVLPHLRRGERILDIGSGTCQVAKIIIDHGYDVALVDITDNSLVPDVHPQLYDGKRLPFPRDSFDLALLLTVLHHIPHPDGTLVEARRVARRIVIIEDVFTSKTEMWLTRIGDSWLNRQIFGHPYSNRSDQGWRETFARLNLHLVDVRQNIHWFFPFRFRHAIYLLSRDDGAEGTGPS